ncbi:MAG: LytTR family transcriptional regulator [Bacteroidales bacterium]|nr:LytTR family transcriptional regulator [Bacteroidales bacterium]
MNLKKANLIIHGFAILHVLLCAGCRALAIPDTLILTLATMAMVVILCLEEDLSTGFTAITIVLANVLGFILGNIGASLGQNYISTFIITEIIGWGLLLMVKLLKPARIEKATFWKENVGWLVAAIVIVFGLRVAIDIIFSGSSLGNTSPSLRLVAEVAAFCLLLLMFFVLQMRNQMELEREKNRSLEKTLRLYRSDNSKYKEKFIVHLNNQIVPVHVKEIAYFFAEKKSTYLVTRSGASQPLDYSLDTIESELDPKLFFRISRSCIIALDSIDSIARVPGSRLELSLTKEIPALTDLTVSRARVSSFLNWFES